MQNNLDDLRMKDNKKKTALDDEIESVIISDLHSENDKIEEVSAELEATAHGSKFNLPQSS